MIFILSFGGHYTVVSACAKFKFLIVLMLFELTLNFWFMDRHLPFDQKLFFDYARQNFSVVINHLWPTEKLSSLQMWSVELPGLEVYLSAVTSVLH